MKRITCILCALSSLLVIAGPVAASPTRPLSPSGPLLDSADPPAAPVKLIFIHHSTGGNWLADPNDGQLYGSLGKALMDNNYFVSATNYGWGPDGIGDRTDIPNWLEWFVGRNRDVYLDALYNESGQNAGSFGDWSRLPNDPGGENVIVMFKSCFPNSNLEGKLDDPPLAEANEWEYSVANAKAVYNALLTYFETRQDKLFVAITAPPLMRSETSRQNAANTRAFNTWLVKDWLADYPHANVAVFDYYNVLTDPDNHHRWNGREIEHVATNGDNFLFYPSGDSHPNTDGHTKAAAEFVPLLNVFYNRWQAAGREEHAPARPTQALADAEQPVEPSTEPVETPRARGGLCAPAPLALALFAAGLVRGRSTRKFT